MRRILLIAITLFTGFNAVAQDTAANKSEKKVKLNFYGDINPQIYVDTRKVLEGREGEMLFYPLPESLDANGNDINAVPQLNMLTITSRLGLRIQTPDMLGAKVTGLMEGDFTGATGSGINMLRLRHAYMDMRWANSELLIGQYWTPFVVHEIMPGTRPLNMGAPFHPYSRTVQARYTQYMGKIEAVAVAAFQLDNKSSGPNGGSAEYLRNSCIPDLTAMLRYNSGRFFLGLGYNFLLLKPRTSLIDDEGNAHITNTMFASHSATLFAKYDFDNWSLRMQAIAAQNMDAHLLMGGYAESPVMTTADGKFYYDYQPFGGYTAWVDFGKSTGTWRPGIFFGYAKNTGFENPIDDGWKLYGRGFDIDYVWRVQPRIGWYVSPNIQFFAEVEYTVAGYGDECDDYHHYTSTNDVANTRFILAAVYKF